MKWFYLIDDKQLGPVEEPDLIQLMEEGKVSAGTLVWKEGTESWIKASDSDISNHLLLVPPPLPTLVPPPLPAVEKAGILESDMINARVVLPRQPPRSVGWMTFLGLLWPGLGQALCGQKSKGITMMISSCFLNYFFSYMLGLPLLSIGMFVLAAIDAHKVARALATGRPIGQWEFFPSTDGGESASQERSFSEDDVVRPRHPTNSSEHIISQDPEMMKAGRVIPITIACIVVFILIVEGC